MKILRSTLYNMHSPRGMTLIEALIAIVVFLAAFVGLYGLFIASVRYVGSARERETATSIGVERMEQMHALSYDDVGTVSGIPSGTLEQNEAIVLDGISYNRRTFVQYVDDPADGTGTSDTNGITADYKRVKVEVSWAASSGSSSIALISNLIPNGVESSAGGGTLSLAAIDAQAAPIADATVHIVNTGGVPSVDVTTYTDTEGMVFFPGTPAASSYEITVTKSGYSQAQTYAATAGNPNPNPGHLTVLAGQTTSASFAIDALASLLVRTWQPIMPATTTDSFSDASGIGAQTDTQVTGDALLLAQNPDLSYISSGTAYSTAFSPSSLAQWASLSWHSSSLPDTSLTMHVYVPNGSGGYAILPDSELAGNAAGFTASPVSLEAVSTSTYPSLVIGVSLNTSDTSVTPSIFDWSLSYRTGPTIRANTTFTLTGSKTIGTTGSGAPVYKESESLSTDAEAEYSTPNLEWDSYSLAIPSSSGFDLSSSCPFQPVSIVPGSSSMIDLFVMPHTSNSLAVAVSDAVSGTAISGATVTLTDTGFSNLERSDSCGGAFFPGLTSASDYSLSVSASGYTTAVLANVSVSGQSAVSVSLSP